MNDIENMKLAAGALAETVKMFYDSLIQQKFNESQALKLTGDYIRAVFGK